jgi:hypothetical protein
MIQPVRAIVEEEQIAIGQWRRGMLAGQRWRTELPDNSAGLPINYDDG